MCILPCECSWLPQLRCFQRLSKSCYQRVNPFFFFYVTLSHPGKNSTENDFTKQCCNYIRSPNTVLIFFADKEIKTAVLYNNMLLVYVHGHH